MATSPLFLSGYRAEQTQFVPGHATRPRIIWTPGASGSLIEKINIATNENATNDFQLYLAKRLTLGSQMGSGALVDNGGSADTVTRSAGSFVTDGWLVGNRIMLQGCTTLANDFMDILTAVSASSLALATGGGTVDTAEALLSATGLYRLIGVSYVDTAAGAGFPNVVAVSALDATQIPALDVSPNRRLNLGPDDYLVGAFATTLGTGEVGDVSVWGGDY